MLGNRLLPHSGEPLSATEVPDSPLLGIHKGTAVYLLYNGILKDKTPDGGNVLTRALLAMLPEHNGPKVNYGIACKIGLDQRLRPGNKFPVYRQTSRRDVEIA